MKAWIKMNLRSFFKNKFEEFSKLAHYLWVPCKTSTSTLIIELAKVWSDISHLDYWHLVCIPTPFIIDYFLFCVSWHFFSRIKPCFCKVSIVQPIHHFSFDIGETGSWSCSTLTIWNMVVWNADHISIWIYTLRSLVSGLNLQWF